MVTPRVTNRALVINYFVIHVSGQQCDCLAASIMSFRASGDARRKLMNRLKLRASQCRQKSITVRLAALLEIIKALPVHDRLFKCSPIPPGRRIRKAVVIYGPEDCLRSCRKGRLPIFSIEASF